VTVATDPVRLRVPAIDVDAPVIPLGLNPDQTLEVPTTASDTGWWTGGSAPGAGGPAVIAGHVNLRSEPGVFAELDRMQVGDTIEVIGDDLVVVRFVVDRVERHPKEAFPTDRVYGPTGGPELRLITCGGAFDEGTGHYLDNVIVFAHRAPAAA
jgi:LPXTG-site transpeptidase (sortase) family protein